MIVYFVPPDVAGENVDRVSAPVPAGLGGVGQNGFYGSAGAPVPTGRAESVRERDNVRLVDVRSAAHVKRVGFVVGRTVGGAVERNAVRRRLRHLMRERLHLLPPGSTLVVRALPAAATVSSADLGADLDAALSRLLGGGVS